MNIGHRNRSATMPSAAKAAVLALVAAIALLGGGAWSRGKAGEPPQIRIGHGADGRLEVQMTAAGWTSRITGFEFDSRNEARARLQDLDRDGDRDLVVISTPLPSYVYSIIVPAEGLPPVLDLGYSGERGGQVVRSRRGDQDNFGYGIGSGPPPCDYYDNREPEDFGVFDYELGHVEELDTWTFTFDIAGTPDGVRLTVYEILSDFEASTIDMDGHTLTFAMVPFMTCGAYGEGGLGRQFVLSGTDAEIAGDGLVTVTFDEAGDDISMDSSRLVVRVP